MGNPDLLAALLANVVLHLLPSSSSDLAKFIVTVTKPFLDCFVFRVRTLARMTEYNLGVFLEEMFP